MTKRTFTDKNNNEWIWEETSETTEALNKLHCGDYQGPLYAPHPDLKNETKIDDKTTNVG